MLSIQNSKSVKGAAAYFSNGLARSDYYSEGDSVPGVWHGRAAALLGLDEAVEADHFQRLLSGLDPHSGDQIIQRMKKNRTPGTEFTFSPPKSISILYAMTSDERIVTAFREAVAGTMADIEQHIQTRVRKGGKYEDRTTGNMLWAEFLHKTARPVDGIACPQLHIHAYQPNLTWDGTEKRWKASKIRKIKLSGADHQNDFQKSLAGSMADLGYAIQHEGKSWEVAGISRAIVERYSARTRRIDEAASARNITHPKWKAGLAVKTRERKTTAFSFAELRAEWKSRLTFVEATQVRAVIDAANDNDDDGSIAFMADNNIPQRHKFWNKPVAERVQLLDELDDSRAHKENNERPEDMASFFEHHGKLGNKHERNIGRYIG